MTRDSNEYQMQQQKLIQKTEELKQLAITGDRKAIGNFLYENINTDLTKEELVAMISNVLEDPQNISEELQNKFRIYRGILAPELLRDGSKEERREALFYRKLEARLASNSGRLEEEYSTFKFKLPYISKAVSELYFQTKNQDVLLQEFLMQKYGHELLPMPIMINQIQSYLACNQNRLTEWEENKVIKQAAIDAIKTGQMRDKNEIEREEEIIAEIKKEDAKLIAKAKANIHIQKWIRNLPEIFDEPEPISLRPEIYLEKDEGEDLEKLKLRLTHDQDRSHDESSSEVNEESSFAKSGRTDESGSYVDNYKGYDLSPIAYAIKYCIDTSSPDESNLNHLKSIINLFDQDVISQVKRYIHKDQDPSPLFKLENSLFAAITKNVSKNQFSYQISEILMTEFAEYAKSHPKAVEALEAARKKFLPEVEDSKQEDVTMQELRPEKESTKTIKPHERQLGSSDTEPTVETGKRMGSELPSSQPKKSRESEQKSATLLANVGEENGQSSGRKG